MLYTLQGICVSFSCNICATRTHAIKTFESLSDKTNKPNFCPFYLLSMVMLVLYYWGNIIFYYT
jgi:hypothetical protein